MSENVKRAAIYARQSEDVAEGIDRQVSRTRKLIEARGWSVAGEYKDNDTSASKDRSTGTRWAAMLADAKAGRFDVVVAVDIDRLLRSMPDLVSLTATGVAVLTVDGEIDLTTADGEFRATMLTGIARFETRRKGERQKRANEARVAQGKPVPGRRRYGYEPDNMTPRPEEAARVLWAFEQIKAGASLRSTAIALDMRPVRVREMLTNAAYRGLVKHKGVFLPSSAITPIVTPEVFDEVGAILADPSRKISPGSAVRHLASGIALCGVCGATLHYMNSYMCNAATNHVSILKRTLEARIEEEVFQWVVEHPEAEDAAVSADLSALLTESAALARQRAQVQEMGMMDGADMALIRTQLAALGKRSDALQERINTERAAASRGGLVEAVRGDWWALRDERPWGPEEEEALAAWPAYWASLGLEKQREVVRSMFKVTVNKGRSFDRVVFEEV